MKLEKIKQLSGSEVFFAVLFTALIAVNLLTSQNYLFCGCLAGYIIIGLHTAFKRINIEDRISFLKEFYDKNGNSLVCNYYFVKEFQRQGVEIDSTTLQSIKYIEENIIPEIDISDIFKTNQLTVKNKKK